MKAGSIPKTAATDSEDHSNSLALNL